MLEEIDDDPENARADLFKRGMFFITAPTNTSEEAYQLASDLSVLLGAAPFLYGCMGNRRIIRCRACSSKIRLGSALVNATMNQPGWHEARKLAGASVRSIHKGSVQYLDEADSYGQMALANRDNMVRVLDNLITELYNSSPIHFRK